MMFLLMGDQQLYSFLGTKRRYKKMRESIELKLKVEFTVSPSRNAPVWQLLAGFEKTLRNSLPFTVSDRSLDPIFFNVNKIKAYAIEVVE